MNGSASISRTRTSVPQYLQDIEYVLKTLSETGTRFEFECYDTAHLYNLNYFLEQGMVKPPLFVQTVRPAGRNRRPSGGRAAHEAHRDRLFATSSSGRCWRRPQPTADPAMAAAMAAISASGSRLAVARLPDGGIERREVQLARSHRRSRP